MPLRRALRPSVLVALVALVEGCLVFARLAAASPETDPRGVELRLPLGSAASSQPAVFELSDPPRLVVDLRGLPAPQRWQRAYETGPVASAVLVGTGDRARAVLALRERVRHTVATLGDELVISLTPLAPMSTDSFCMTLPGWRALFAPAAEGKDKRKSNRKNTPRWPELMLEANVNGAPTAAMLQAVCLPDGRLALLERDWKALHLRPTEALILPDGRTGFALESAAELRYSVDMLTQRIAITAPAGAFEGTAVTGRTALDPVPPPAPPGAYLNYDLTAQRGARGDFSYGAFAEAVFFNGYGLLVANGLMREEPGGLRFVRGDTYWEKPFPGEMTTLRIGDAVGVGGAWSRPARFGGIRYARDFGTRPGFVTFPMPTLAGSAALPSTVEVLIDNQRRFTTRVPAGPFEITDAPALGGAPGELNLVVRDALGRETVITQSYYMSPRLLAPGLSDFSFEAGWLRTGFATSGSQYRDLFGAATYRRGLNARVTGEVRAEVERDRMAGGLGLTALAGRYGTINLGAGYAAAGGRGGLHLVGSYDIAGRLASASIGGEWFDAHYRPFAAGENEVRLRGRMFVGGSVSLGTAGRLSASYVRQSQRDGRESEFLSLGWGRQFGRGMSLSATGTHDLANGDSSAWLSVHVNLSPQVSGTASLRHSGGAQLVQAELRSPTPTGPGFGWRLRASDAPGQPLGASGLWNTEVARISADAAVGDSGTAVRGSVAGSVGVLSGHGFASRPITDSFAVVRTGDVAGATVLRSNQPAAITDADGVALVTGLRPFQRNHLSVDPAELPMDVEIDGTERYARPWPRSGVFVDMPIRRTRQALVALQLPDGEPVPQGATVAYEGAAEATRVARRGEVWLTGLQDENALTVTLKDGTRCLARFTLPADAPPGARLGPITCADQERRP